jgi:hypothetical protein
MPQNNGMRTEQAVSVSIRTVEAIDAEIERLERDVEAQSAACDWQDARIDSDEFDGGIVRKQRHSGALHNGSAIAAARNDRRALGAERVAMRDEIRELRRERSLWTDRTPLGMLEIAAMLGYTPEAARQWKHRNVLPVPAGTVSATPYWYRAAILEWALAHGKTRAIVCFDPTEYDSDYEEAV